MSTSAQARPGAGAGARPAPVPVHGPAGSLPVRRPEPSACSWSWPHCSGCCRRSGC